MTEHDDSRIREAMRDVLRDELPEAVKTATREVLLSIGISIKDDDARLAMQQDMAFLRRLRMQVGVLAMAAATGIVSGAVTLWQNFFGGAAPPHH